MKVIVKLNKNTDGSTFFTYIGLDNRAWEILTGEWATSPDGSTTLERVMEMNKLNIVPIIPLPEDLFPWDPRGEYPDGPGNGFIHSIYLVKAGGFRNNTTVEMQAPGQVFTTLPQEIQEQLTDNISKLKVLPNPRGQGANFIPFESFLLPDGISQEMAMALRRISVAGFLPDGLDGSRVKP